MPMDTKGAGGGGGDFPQKLWKTMGSVESYLNLSNDNEIDLFATTGCIKKLNRYEVALNFAKQL